MDTAADEAYYKQLQGFVSRLVERARLDQRLRHLIGYQRWDEFLDQVDQANSSPDDGVLYSDNKRIVHSTDWALSRRVTEVLKQSGPDTPLAYARRNMRLGDQTELDFKVRVIPNEAQEKLSPLLNRAGAWVQTLEGETVMVLPQRFAEEFLADVEAGKTQPIRRSTVAIIGHELAHTKVVMTMTSDTEVYFGAHITELYADLMSNDSGYGDSADLIRAVEIATGYKVTETLRQVQQPSDVVPFFEALEKEIGSTHVLLLGVMAPYNYEVLRTREFWPFDEDDFKETQFLESLIVDQCKRKGPEVVRQNVRHGLTSLPPGVGRMGWGSLEAYFGFDLPAMFVDEFDAARKDGSLTRGPLTRLQTEIVSNAVRYEGGTDSVFLDAKKSAIAIESLRLS